MASESLNVVDYMETPDVHSVAEAVAEAVSGTSESHTPTTTAEAGHHVETLSISTGEKKKPLALLLGACSKECAQPSINTLAFTLRVGWV